jgi:signal transduction histidine kinase
LLKENLFKLDFNTNRKGTEGEPSTGLGLILCHDFIEKHGGKLWVESEPGIGSVFYFTIPSHPNYTIELKQY